MKNPSSLDAFLCGKEYDLKKYNPNISVTGGRFVLSEHTIRFLCRLTFQGTKISKSLGTLPRSEFESNLPTIVEKIRTFHIRMAQGLHPFEEIQDLKDITFSEFALSSYMPNAMSRKKSYKDDASRLRIHLNPIIGSLKLRDINVAVLHPLLNDLTKKGLSPASVNRIRALLSSLFNLAIDHELITTNPITRIKKFRENNQKERYLNADETKSLVTILGQPTDYGIHNAVIVAIVHFLLLTGVRKREAMDMRWSDVDLTTGVWLLGENKSGKARRINLNQDALQILQQLPKQSLFIFANPETNKPYNDIRKTFDKIMHAAGVYNMRIHDLRHNFASLAVNSGQSLYVVQHLLGHASPQTTQRYAHLQSNTLKQASEDIAAALRSQRQYSA